MAEVLAIVEIELADGVDSDEFERFALREYVPSVAELGVAVTLVRGHRGPGGRARPARPDPTRAPHRYRPCNRLRSRSRATIRWRCHSGRMPRRLCADRGQPA